MSVDLNADLQTFVLGYEAREANRPKTDAGSQPRERRPEWLRGWHRCDTDRARAGETPAKSETL